MDMSLNRRGFLAECGRAAAGAGMLALAARPGAANPQAAGLARISGAFPRYTKHNPAVPVYCVTPDRDGCFHRFFNTSSISPSGRYLAATRLLHEDRQATPGEEAEVVLVDLQEGTSRVVAVTKGFDSQLGAQAQWGATDNELFFNDLDIKTWRAFGVRLDPVSGVRRALEGPVFEVSRDGRYAASICLARSALTQRGYGVVVPAEILPWNHGAARDDGVYLTDVQTGRCRLIASFKDIADACGEKVLPAEPERGGGYHGHQISWNPQGTRLMLCMAWDYPQPPTANTLRCEISLITMRPDGSDIQVAFPSRIWRRLANRHHPCWLPDGDHISLNAVLDGKRMSLVSMRYDGDGVSPEGLRPLADPPSKTFMAYDGRGLTHLTKTVLGGGHPSMRADGRYVITDAYQREPCTFGDGSVPLRLINIADDTEQNIVRIHSVPPFLDPLLALRVDPHPAWDRSGTRVAFNACPDGTRRVYVAELSGLLS